MAMILPVASKTVLIGSSNYQSLLDGVHLINLGLEKKEVTVLTLKNSKDDTNYSLGLHCTTCQIAFELSEEHRTHYKSDWHRYNLKQKIRNRQTIDEIKFFALENKANDSSSSSESDDEINAYNSHFSIDSRLFFENNSGNAFSVYRCLLTNKKDIPKEEIVVHSLKSIGSLPMWFIVMLGGGRFSAAIFKGEEAIVHKTFHSYTVRAKQGGSQSTQDKSKGGCKSAGASLRRYNEASQLKHIQEILTSWLHHIKVCDHIFYRAIGPNNRNILFGGSSPLIDKNDSRLCQIPFGTKKATFGEVQKVCKQLSTVLVYDSKEIVNNSIQNYVLKLFKKRKSKESNMKHTNKSLNKPIENNRNSSEKICEHFQSEESDVSNNVIESETIILPQSKILCENNSNVLSSEVKNKKRRKKNKKPKEIIKICAEVEELKILLLQTIVEKNADTLNKYLLLEGLNSSITEEYLKDSLNEALDEKNNTVLHLASTNCLHDHIYLLLEHGSNPVLKNKDAKTPYELAPDKSTRKVFRKFMALFPDKYNYDKARLPGPLTEELQEELKERKKAKQKRAKERKVVEELKKEEEIEKEKFLQLTDREKCAIAAEKRFMKTQGILLRCFYCGKNIEEKFPFEYMDYKFCSVQCVKNHRQKNLS